MIAPVQSTRSGDIITVVFDNDIATEIPCPPALIGNPVARLIAEAAAWRTKPTPPYVLRDCLPEHEADLQELLASMPVEGRFDCEPGWYRLVAEAWRAMRRADPVCIVTEVKQKVGELRISCRNGAGELDTAFFQHCVIVRDASARTCEWCAGETDAAAGVGSPSRLCDNCRDFSVRWGEAWREGENG